MTMRSPIFTLVSGAMLLALASDQDRLAVEPRDAVQRLAGRDDMNGGSRSERHAGRRDRRSRW